ncbi:protocatechuate 3,4-dioxygenase subunit beta [Sabulicella glaciei]|uniref:Protocatechuate 3,4-dioxygenase subunit beta n=1 Tax=Sabulicella glaciei TaxID=2984948 RepID=A0ABT3NQK7_9PROT|nr:protocatechuate 3,4-dioxygenase subunit beta [Roseococcus sp. MDT2-1-1]MCW8084432.1 protocatechuate 3,4-dioxygenase subunit beta [Roseococcus sp. MDT2-1-1]
MADPLPFRRDDPAHQPPLDAPAYRSTQGRAPLLAPIRAPVTLTEASAPRFDPAHYPPRLDLSRLEGRQAQGERIVVAGRLTDGDGRPVANAMIEVWQANAAGRYDHPGDQHDAPLDPNFLGRGRLFTDEKGEYRFETIKPGAYPWGNHHNAWRPNHIHFGVHGAGSAQRLITQMYFPGDPLLALDPVFNTIPDAGARERLVSRFELDLTVPEYALGYRFDIVLRGRDSTPFEEGHP